MTTEQTLTRTLFSYAKAAARTLTNPPAIRLVVGEYDNDTVEIGGTYTIHVEVRPVKAIVPRDAIHAIVGANVLCSNYPDAPDEYDWQELSAHQSMIDGAVDAVSRFAEQQMYSAIDRATPVDPDEDV